MIPTSHVESIQESPFVIDPEIEELELHNAASIGGGTPTVIGVVAIYSLLV